MIESLQHLVLRCDPAATAVVQGDRQVTYGELVRYIADLVVRLQRSGVRKGDFVALHMNRSVESLTGSLAILSVGAVYVPMDPTYPRAHNEHILQEVRPRALITTTSLSRELPPSESAVIIHDDVACRSGREPDDLQPVANDSRDLAYVMFTSGSTGRPKGVMIEHAGLSNLIEAQRIHFALRPEDRVLQYAPLCFDASIFEIALALGAGATLVIPEQVPVLPGGDLESLLVEKSVTVATLSPTVLGMLDDGPFPRLHTMISAGESCPAAVVNRFAAERRFFNAYGPTEATVWSTLALCQPDGADPTIGYPVHNVQIHILDEEGHRVVDGKEGEICIGGAGVARGYLNQPGLSYDRFSADPFSPHIDGRLYRSGDRGRVLNDGEIQFLGRIDDQISLHGFRIEPGEIESHLLLHPGVRAAVVVARSDVVGPKKLLAYVVQEPGRSPLENEIRNWLATQLPSHMVPARIVFVDAFPLTPGAKVDRSALPSPMRPRPGLQVEYKAPSSVVEREIASVWEEILEVQGIGILDNFFELGGDSIAAIRASVKGTSGGVRFSPADVFAHPTVSELAGIARRGWHEPEYESDEAAVKTLTPIQRWFFEQQFVQPNRWNMAVALEARERLDRTLIRRAVENCVLRYGSFNRRYLSDGAVAAGASNSDPLTWLDVEEWSVDGKDRDDRLAEVGERLQSALDIERGPLMAAALIPSPSLPDLLVLVAHHLAIDAFSWQIVVQDIEAGYRSLRLGQDIAFPHRADSVDRWAAGLQRFARSGMALSHAEFWARYGRGFNFEIPRDFQHGANTESSSGVARASLGELETALLLTEVPRVGFKVLDVLLAALSRVLAAWSEVSPVWFDVERHGRDASSLGLSLDAGGTVGWFTSLSPVRVDVPDGDESTVLVSVGRQLSAVPSEGLSYGALRYVGPDPDVAAAMAQLPEREVVFNFLGQMDLPIQTSTLFKSPIRHIPGSRGPANHRTHLLELNALVERGQFVCELAYSRNIHLADTAQMLVEGFMREVHNFAVRCSELESHAHARGVENPLPGLNSAQISRIEQKLSSGRRQ